VNIDKLRVLIQVRLVFYKNYATWMESFKTRTCATKCSLSIICNKTCFAKFHLCKVLCKDVSAQHSAMPATVTATRTLWQMTRDKAHVRLPVVQWSTKDAAADNCAVNDTRLCVCCVQTLLSGYVTRAWLDDGVSKQMFCLALRSSSLLHPAIPPCYTARVLAAKPSSRWWSNFVNQRS